MFFLFILFAAKTRAYGAIIITPIYRTGFFPQPSLTGPHLPVHICKCSLWAVSRARVAVAVFVVVYRYIKCMYIIGTRHHRTWVQQFLLITKLESCSTALNCARTHTPSCYIMYDYLCVGKEKKPPPLIGRC